MITAKSKLSGALRRMLAYRESPAHRGGGSSCRKSPNGPISGLDTRPSGECRLIRLRGDNVDLAGWNKAQYASELLKAVESEDALSRYDARDLVDRIDRLPGQYRVGPVLNWFSASLEEYRSDDNRTMYVGITEANIFSGDNNYIFSSGIPKGKSPASVLSYSMMLAETLSEEHESRQRLTERIAKELVPASLKQLRIPRPLDPTDPYSYSSGVTRLDQKTLVLSESVKDALKRIRAN